LAPELRLLSKKSSMPLWDEEGYFDPDAEELRPGPQRNQVLASMEDRAALVLARRLAYEGLTPPKAIRLDEFVAAMGSEGTRRRIGRRMAFAPFLSKVERGGIG
jgi:hypothetical protein